MRRAGLRWWWLRRRVAGLVVRFGAVRVMVTAVLVAGWLVAFGYTLVAAGTDLTCTAADPSVCGPDAGSSWIGLALATPVLLCWRPRLGAVAGLLFAVAENVWDPDPAGHLPFALHGALCLLGFATLGRRRRVPETVVVPERRHPYFDEAERWDPASLLNAVVLAWACVPLTLGCLGWYAERVHVEQGHVAVAVRVTGVVSAVDGTDDTVAVDLPGPSRALRTSRPIGVLDVGPYRVGSSVPVLVDPHDPGWVRLVAEPQDETMWLTAATFCGSLALAVGIDRAGERRRVSVSRGRPRRPPRPRRPARRARPARS